MPATTEGELPNLGAIFSAVLARVPAEQRPLLIALAERLAATRYRVWAEEVGDPERGAALTACAEREEEIARRVEALYPDAARMQQDILAANPDLTETNRRVFAGRPLAQQFAIQAEGERLGAATWRAFAKADERDEARRTFLDCARFEEESAAFLESLA